MTSGSRLLRLTWWLYHCKLADRQGNGPRPPGAQRPHPLQEAGWRLRSLCVPPRGHRSAGPPCPQPIPAADQRSANTWLWKPHSSWEGDGTGSCAFRSWETWVREHPRVVQNRGTQQGLAETSCALVQGGGRVGVAVSGPGPGRLPQALVARPGWRQQVLGGLGAAPGPQSRMSVSKGARW